jgi:hypothetical protein
MEIMGDFLGTNKVSDNITAYNNYISYNDAKEYLKDRNIESSVEYKKLYSDVKFLPNRPERYYKNRGWLGWKDYLSKVDRVYLSYKEAVIFISKNNIKSVSQYRSFIKLNNIDFLNTNPEYFYADEWINWQHYLNKN